MIRKATAEDRQAFSILWAEFLRDANKAGSDILPTPYNLEVSLRIFDLYVDGGLLGVVYIAEGIGVTMAGEAAFPQTFESSYGKIATAWGTYVREGHRGKGWSRRLREKGSRWAARHGFDVATGPIAFSNEASLESCKKLGIETPAVVGVRYLKGVHDGD